MKIQMLAAALILFTLNAFGENCYPLSIGNIWYYTTVENISDTSFITVSIPSDTTVGNVHYFKYLSVTSYLDGSENDTSISWECISGDDVYDVPDLSEPDQKAEIAKLRFNEGDTLNLSSDASISLLLHVTAGGSITVPYKTFANTWKASLLDSSLGVDYDFSFYYADGAGIVKVFEKLGETIYYEMELDSMKLSGDPVIRFASPRAKCNSIIADSKGITIHSSSDKLTVTLLSINGRKIAKKEIVTNTFVPFNQIFPGISRGQYILSTQGLGSVNFTIPR